MSENKARLLYVEDDLTLSFVTRDNLEIKGYDVEHCLDGEEALNKFGEGSYDLCILDVMLPKMDGFTLAAKIRETDQEIPIIFLTAKSTNEDKIYGLKTGGDDYITKPFSIEELALRIDIFLRRRRIVEENAEPLENYRLGKFEINFRNYTITEGVEEKKMTFRESELLRLLCEEADQIIKREDILMSLWGDDSYYNSRSMDVFISRLRKYLKNDPGIKIENIHGVGFRLNTQYNQS